MKSLIFAFCVFALVSCSKNSDPAPVTPPTVSKPTVKFYSSTAAVAVKNISIRVNGADYGRLMYSATMPSCSAGAFASIVLAPGIYKADYIDPNSTMASRQVSFTVPASVTGCIFFDLK